MSWDSYIDNLIAQSKDAAGSAHADRACIIGLDGGASWTTAGHGCALKVRQGVTSTAGMKGRWEVLERGGI
jgi:profilin